MKGQAVWATLSKYLSSLVMTILAPLQWMRLLKMAKQHHGLDPRASKKILTGIVAGILLAGISTMVVVNFQATATEGVYSTLDGRLSAALGNDQYEAHLKEQEAATNLIATADRKIAESQAAGDAEAEQLWRDNRAVFVADRNEAIRNANNLIPNVLLYKDVQAALVDQNDVAAKQLIDQRFNVDYPSLDARAESAFAAKDASVSEMQNFLLWFVYPGLIGVLWAPLAYAGGHVLKTTFVPSDSVGFKQYPGGAAAWFLLFGAFGVPAVFFAAWVMQDMIERTETGQISL